MLFSFNLQWFVWMGNSPIFMSNKYTFKQWELPVLQSQALTFWINHWLDHSPSRSAAWNQSWQRPSLLTDSFYTSSLCPLSCPNALWFTDHPYSIWLVLYNLHKKFCYADFSQACCWKDVIWYKVHLHRENKRGRPFVQFLKFAVVVR